MCTVETVSSCSSDGLRDYFGRTYVASNLVIAAAGNLQHATLRPLVERAFGTPPQQSSDDQTAPPDVTPGVAERHKEIEQSHICLGTPAYAHAHPDRHALYILNTILGGSMSSRLFQHIREERGLAYAVFSHLTSYSDAGMMTVYAGCANAQRRDVVALTPREMRTIRDTLVTADELRRAKDHLKGSLMLGLESTSSRMSHLARQEMYFDRQFSLDETLQGVEAVTRDDVRRVTDELFAPSGLAATVLGAVNGLEIPRERLLLG